MGKNVFIVIIVFIILFIGYFTFFSKKSIFNLSPPISEKEKSEIFPDTALAAKFDYLSKNGNSACSLSFYESIPSMTDDARLQGSCCSPMSPHRYLEQITGLKKYTNISEIPSDPYNIEVGLAKKLISYYDGELTQKEQMAYDFAMENSDEKGPCCCKCWRWYVYGGLAKLLIKNYNFNGEQITEIWNLSDGCGGEGDHVH